LAAASQDAFMFLGRNVQSPKQYATGNAGYIPIRNIPCPREGNQNKALEWV
jgi:hypothetical protein